MWIYNNVRAKWDSIVRRPTKLLEMFSGYHARHSFVLEALARMDIPANQYPAEVPSWTPLHLHRLVAHFLRVRFPVLLALNKADVGSAAAHIARIASTCDEPSVPVSAHCEWSLCQLRRQGVIIYPYGGASFAPTGTAGAVGEGAVKLDNTLVSSCRSVFEKFGSTGVLQTLDRAISLNPPLYVYPVETLDTCESIARSKEREFLRDCFLMHPGV
jgi:ribosome-binding ATPase YchF (GTP1/OBG family)